VDEVASSGDCPCGRPPRIALGEIGGAPLGTLGLPAGVVGEPPAEAVLLTFACGVAGSLPVLEPPLPLGPGEGSWSPLGLSDPLRSGVAGCALGWEGSTMGWGPV
jgi:hypothetical protein